MKIGELDVTNSILDLEHRMLVMENILNYIANNNSNVKMPVQFEFEKFKEDALDALQKKYPGMGITKKQ